jgi:hypothetical protein
VLGHFAALHRSHADALLPHLGPVIAPQPGLRTELLNMRTTVARDASRWIEEFITSERKLRAIYMATILALGATPAASRLARLLDRQRSTLDERLQEIFAELGGPGMGPPAGGTALPNP